jgi:8-oxo-dGTP diphosphatase
LIDTGRGVKALIINGQEVLILVKPNGVSDLPGGKVEYGENRKEALYREIVEETGLITEIHDPIAGWSFTKSNGLQITGVTYLCQYLGGQVSLSSEHSDFHWLPRKKVESRNLRAGWMNTAKLKNHGFAKFVFSPEFTVENSWRYYAACKTRKYQAKISILSE